MWFGIPIQDAEVFETLGLLLWVVPLERECLEYFPKSGLLFSSCRKLACPSFAGSSSFWLFILSDGCNCHSDIT